MGGSEERVIAIAGAGGGLGPSVVAQLAAHGARLGLADRDEEALEPALAGLDLDEDRLDARAVDLLDPAAAAGWAEELEARFGGVDALLHLVGGWRGGDPIETASLEDYEWLHDALVRTVQSTSRAFYAALNRSGSGRFVLISSAQAQEPEGTNAAYAATKAAAESWTLALADAFASEGKGASANIIVVNAILTPGMRERNPDKQYPSFTPAEDVAAACAFICSDAGGRMNGKRWPLHP